MSGDKCNFEDSAYYFSIARPSGCAGVKVVLEMWQVLYILQSHIHGQHRPGDGLFVDSAESTAQYTVYFLSSK